MPWAIIKNNVIIDSIHGGAPELSVLTFNVVAALCAGKVVVVVCASCVTNSLNV